MNQYPTQAACRAACRPGEYAAGHINLATGETYWMVAQGEVISVGRKARSERHVYTPSGKKRSIKQVCLSLYRPTLTRDQFVAKAVGKGVKGNTARLAYYAIVAGRI